MSSFKFYSFFRCLKARHEAVSFEAAEWSERLTSGQVGWQGAAAVGSIPALVTFFSFSSLLLLLLLLLLFLSSLSKPIFLLFTRNYFQENTQWSGHSAFHKCTFYGESYHLIVSLLQYRH